MYAFIFCDKVHKPTKMILVQPQNQIESGLSSGSALYGNKIRNLCCSFIGRFMIYFGFGQRGVQRSFCEGFSVSYLRKRAGCFR
jgi:hypothetical protein